MFLYSPLLELKKFNCIKFYFERIIKYNKNDIYITFPPAVNKELECDEICYITNRNVKNLWFDSKLCIFKSLIILENQSFLQMVEWILNKEINYSHILKMIHEISSVKYLEKIHILINFIFNKNKIVKMINEHPSKITKQLVKIVNNLNKSENGILNEFETFINSNYVPSIIILIKKLYKIIDNCKDIPDLMFDKDFKNLEKDFTFKLKTAYEIKKDFMSNLEIEIIQNKFLDYILFEYKSKDISLNYNYTNIDIIDLTKETKIQDIQIIDLTKQ